MKWETGTVLSFRTNEKGGFGFLGLEDGARLYFDRRGGGIVTVLPLANDPSIDQDETIAMPKQGDKIVFLRGENRNGEIASPWTFEDGFEVAWKQARQRASIPPMIRLIETTGRVGKRSVEEEIWIGRNSELDETFSTDLHFAMKQGSGGWVQHRFEVRRGQSDEWQRIEGDIRPLHDNPKRRLQRAS